MTPFGPSGPEIPQAPIDIPTPEIPAANFRTIGQQIGQGLKDIGNALDVVDKLIGAIANIVTKIAVAVLSIWEWIVAKLLAILLKILQGGESGADEITETVLGGLLSSKHEQHSISLVKAIMDQLGSSPGAGTTGGMSPSSAGAENFLRLTSRIEIEAWVWGVLAEEGSLGFLKNIGGLKEALEGGLGLSRLARRALAPPMKILVEDPFTWLLNNQYRPRLPGEAEAVRQFLRDIIKRPELDRVLGWQGYPADAIEAVINLNRVHLTPGEIDSAIINNVMDADAGKQLLKDQGYDDTTAAAVLAIARAKRYESLRMENARIAIENYGTGKIPQAEFERLITDAGRDQVETQLLLAQGELKVHNHRELFSIAEAMKLVEQGIWGIDQFHDLAIARGYSEDDELDLETLTFAKVKSIGEAQAAKAAAQQAKQHAAAAKVKAALEKAVAAKAAAEAKGVTLGKFETLVKDGKRSITDYRVYLVSKGVAADNIDALVSALQASLDKSTTGAAAKPARTAAAKTKQLDLAQLEASVLAGIISISEYKTRLTAAGFDDADAADLVALLQDKLDAAALKKGTKASVAGALKPKGIDLAQEERAVRLGLQTIEQYGAFLSSHGYDDADTGLLVQELQAQLDKDKAARASKAGVAKTLAAKGLSLPSLEKAVRAGVKTIADYQTALAGAGYDADAQGALVSLLELQMETDKDTLAAKGRAAALLGQVGVSLTETERAAKLGVVPVETYTAQLTSAGLTAPDVQLLTLSLAAQLAKGKTSAAKTPTVAQQVKAAGLSLPSLEADVRAGRLTVDQFESTLSGVGVAAADAADLGQLLTDELANAAHIKALTGAATKAAAAKGLSLGEETAAVKAGVKTLADYRVFVADLGFSPADVETLAATLQAQMTPKTKAPSKTPPAPPLASPGAV
jgi:hypothetical protein